MLKKKAGEYGITKSEFLRQIILFGGIQGVPRIDEEKYNHLVYELNRIGNNINQIAYHANSKKAYGKDEVLQLKSEYMDLLALYMKVFFE